MAAGGEPQRIQLEVQADFPSPKYEKVLRVIGTSQADSALLETSTGFTEAEVVGGIRLREGQIADVQGVQIAHHAHGPDIATLWVTKHD